MTSILVLTNDLILEKMLFVTLTINGFEVKTTHDLIDAEEFLSSGACSFLILDHDFTEDETLEFCQSVRINRNIPILILGEEDYDLAIHGVDSLQRGAGFNDIRMRMNKLMKKKSTLPEKVIHYGGLTIDLTSKFVTFNGHLLEMGKMEFAILVSLARRAGEVVCKKSMRLDLEAQGQFFNATLYHHIKDLKTKLPAALSLKLIVGEGYRLISV